MPDRRDLDRRNDARFITPLLVMALILAVGILIVTYGGQSLAGS